MVVKVFCGKKSKFEHELNQLEEVHNLINNEYAKKDDLIYILTNFRLSNTEIDVLVLTEKGLAIIDLKSYEGEIKGSETGEWKVITKNGDVVPLKDNLFEKFQEKRSALRRKLFRIQEAGNFEHIEPEFLSRISSWGYFPKGSTYNLKQVDDAVRIWFDVITGDKLLRKIIFLNAGYKLKQEDMNAIVEGLNLKPYSFEKYAPTITQSSESLANTEELRTPKKEDIFEKVKPQMAHASQAVYVDERMHGDVLEHKHPEYDYWHPASRLHKMEETYPSKFSRWYLFSWDGGFGNDSESLIYFLKQKFGIDPSRYTYEKSDDGKTIRLSFKNNSLSLILNDAKTKVTLKIDDGRMDEFIVVNEYGKLNIYKT